MKETYKRMMGESKRIASALGIPSFYTRHQRHLSISKGIYSNDEQVIECRRRVVSHLVDNFGHGLEHAEKVTIDVGTIVCIEGEQLSLECSKMRKAIVVAQLSGLFHDIKRDVPNHAKASARQAELELMNFALRKSEREIVVQSIANHEAFVVPQKVSSQLGQLISDSLYDADKFRWGIDNFTSTLWYMTDFQKTPVELMIERFPEGLEAIRRIKDTFRTETGKKYGPEFIDLGLEIGERIYHYLVSFSYLHK